MDSLQIYFLTPYPASCLVRGLDGRPKSMQWGGVERARVSSAALKRAVRVSEVFKNEMDGHIGFRTARLGEMVMAELAAGGADPVAALKGTAILFAGGKADRDAAKGKLKGKKAPESKAEGEDADGIADEDDSETGSGDRQTGGARLGKVKTASTLRLEQLVFVSPQEVKSAASLVKRIMDGQEPTADEIKSIIGTTTQGVDIALFGRMFADRSDLRMTAAAQVAHPFTVGGAQMEADFYVAVDDMKPLSEDVGAGFMGEQGFVAGLFYGYARVDVGQLVRNLGGTPSDKALADKAIRAFVRALLTVSPSGKAASFGSYANATWAMIERGSSAPRSLAGAFLRPVTGEDHHAEAVKRVEKLAVDMARAYDEDWHRATMDVSAGEGSLRELLALVDQPVR